MSDLNQRLAEIRNMQGLPPMPNPHVIQGFGGPGDAPSPPPPRNPEPDYILNPEDEPDDEGQAPIPSALFPKKPTPTIMGAQPTPENPLPNFALVVMDQYAAWKGRVVDLTEPESASVRRIVLQAIQRELDADLAAVAAPRRARSQKTTQNPIPTQKPSGEAPKKRGRPRKVTA